MPEMTSHGRALVAYCEAQKNSDLRAGGSNPARCFFFLLFLFFFFLFRILSLSLSLSLFPFFFLD